MTGWRVFSIVIMSSATFITLGNFFGGIHNEDRGEVIVGTIGTILYGLVLLHLCGILV